MEALASLSSTSCPSSSLCSSFLPKGSALLKGTSSSWISSSRSSSCCAPVRGAAIANSKQSSSSSKGGLAEGFLSFAGKGLAAAALSVALQMGPIHQALADEFNLLRDGPPKDTYVADDAGVLNRVTKSDIKRLLSDLEDRTGFHIDMVTLRKLTHGNMMIIGSFYTPLHHEGDEALQVLEFWFLALIRGLVAEYFIGILGIRGLLEPETHGAEPSFQYITLLVSSGKANGELAADGLVDHYRQAKTGVFFEYLQLVVSLAKADIFEFSDQLLEKWYPSLEEGNKKGLVFLVTTQKEGAVTGGPEFIKKVGDKVLEGVVAENLPVLATEEKYNEAFYSTAKRLVGAIDGLPDVEGPKFQDTKRESNFKTREQTDEKRGQFTIVVGGLLVIAFVVPMAQYYAYVSKK